MSSYEHPHEEPGIGTVSAGLWRTGLLVVRDLFFVLLLALRLLWRLIRWGFATAKSLFF